MNRFNTKVNAILEKTKLDANELKPGDKCVNTNPECQHYKSRGTVTKVKTVKDNTGVSVSIQHVKVC